MSDPVLDRVRAAVDMVGGLPLEWLLVAVFTAMALESSIGLGYVVPGDSVLLVAATAGATDATSSALLVTATVSGSLVGESVGFAMGRLVGPRVRTTRLGRWVGESRWRRADEAVARRGGVAVLLSRFLPGIHSAVPVAAGGTAMPYRRFILWTASGAVVWACLYVGAGRLLRTSYAAYVDRLDLVGWVVAAGTAVVVAVVLIRRRASARVAV